jgi:hypothetical protein
LGKAGSIEIRIPAFSVSESMSSLRNRQRDREKLLGDIDKQLRECGRSPLFDSMVSDLEKVRLGLAAAMDEEASRLGELRQAINTDAITIPLDSEALNWSVFAQIFELFKQVPDMMIFGSIYADLEQRQERGDRDASWFLNRNKRDFDTPEVKELLSQRGCAVINSFDDALGLIKSGL